MKERDLRALTIVLAIALVGMIYWKDYRDQHPKKQMTACGLLDDAFATAYTQGKIIDLPSGKRFVQLIPWEGESSMNSIRDHILLTNRASGQSPRCIEIDRPVPGARYWEVWFYVLEH